MSTPTSKRQRTSGSTSDSTSVRQGPSDANECEPSPSWPVTELSRTAVSDLAFELPTGAQDADNRAGRRYSTNLLLQWLETWPGNTWQQRWNASGVEAHGRQWREAPTAFVFKQIEVSEFVARRHVVTGVGCLLCLGVLRPGYDWMVTSHFSDTYRSIRALVGPGFFSEVIERSQEAGHRERVRVDALNHLTRVIAHTGLSPRELVPDDLLAYRTALLASGRQADSLGLAWDMLRRAKVFSADTPTLQAALRRGQQSVAELVDGYQLVCRPVRDVILRYLTERAGGVDYVTLRGLVAHLAGYFWKDLEEHHPGSTASTWSPRWRPRGNNVPGCSAAVLARDNLDRIATASCSQSVRSTSTSPSGPSKTQAGHRGRYAAPFATRTSAGR